MKKEYPPKGTQINERFYDTDMLTLENLGKQYVITDFMAVLQYEHVYK